MKNFILLYAFLSYSMISWGQNTLNISKSAGQDIVENALASSIKVVRLPYYLKDRTTNNLFGREGREEFGRTYRIAAETTDGVVLGKDNVKPWEDDIDYVSFRNDYDATLGKNTALRSWGEVDFVPSVITTESSYALCTRNESQSELYIDRTLGEKKGWIVWFNSETNLAQNEAAKIECKPYTMTVELTDSLKSIPLTKIPSVDNILGGIFVCPEYIGKGSVVFNVVGLIERSIDVWNLTFPFGSNSEYKEESVTIIPISSQTPTNVQLTPIVSNGEDEDTAPKGKNNKKKIKK